MTNLRLEKNKLNKKLRRSVAKAISDFNMIEDGDRVLVCLSGGKDSFTMLDILLSLRDHAPINFEILAFNLDQKQPGFPERVLPDYLRTWVYTFFFFFSWGEGGGHMPAPLN